ncbi:hypothetical protein AVEN_42798-1 [Araneus ventricosus]|uniref:Uncharacterized protein n=1 Tax=Araneus ventricosus TaxID=182803 RepID=A0A4Y2AG76_ARAVE|nr:hypothetical protein AVEN_42798-1 [Araneus ventricosus]
MSVVWYVIVRYYGLGFMTGRFQFRNRFYQRSAVYPDLVSGLIWHRGLNVLLMVSNFGPKAQVWSSSSDLGSKRRGSYQNSSRVASK